VRWESWRAGGMHTCMQCALGKREPRSPPTMIEREDVRGGGGGGVDDDVYIYAHM
jgi:hypothetical protein